MPQFIGTVKDGRRVGGYLLARTFVLSVTLVATELVTASGSAAQQSYRAYQSLSGGVRNPFGQTLAKSSSHPGVPVRFQGWKQPGGADPEYLRRFSRPRERVRRAEILKNTAATAAHLSTPATTFPPSALPGLLLRDSLPAGYIPTSVAAGDFNGDGKLDFVVANGGDNTLWFYFGKGDGTFNLPIILPIMLGQTPIWVATSDLRGIGRTDLVVAEADSNSIGVFLGNGDGTFAESSVALGAKPFTLIVGDFNHDGKPDVVVSAYNGTSANLAVLPGLGNGQFGPPIISGPTASIFSLSSADLNGDGYPDLLTTANSDMATVQIYLNNRDATFSAGQALAENPGGDEVFLSNILFDADGDGKTDALVSDSWGLLWVFHGNGDGTFDVNNFNTFGIGDLGLGIGVADVNGDGHLDVIVSGLSVNGSPYGVDAGNQICVLQGDGKGNFGPAKVYRGDSSAFSMVVGDFNGDGHPDIVTANQYNDSVSVFMNDGLGGYGLPKGNWVGFSEGGAVNAPLTGAITADLDGDGTKDVAFIEWNLLTSNYFQLTVLLNDGKGNLSAPIRSDAVLASAEPGDFVFADFRNTGQLDFLSIADTNAASSPYISFAANAGGGKFAPPKITTPANASGMIGVGDFDHDGNLDFVAAGQCYVDPNNPSCLRTFLGNGDGTFRNGSVQGFAGNVSGAPPVAVYVGDYNGDGKLDLLILLDANNGWGNGDDVYEFFGNGDGTFQPGKLLFSHFGPMVVADVNGDGRPDIINMLFPIALDETAQPVQFSIYLGQPDGSFVLSNTYSPYGYRSILPEATQAQRESGYYAPLVGDFNGDGKIDIAAVQASGTLNLDTFVQFLLGNGDGTFTPSYDIFDFHKPAVALYAANLASPTRTDLFELDSYRSSDVVLPSVVAPAFQFALMEDPVPGSQGSAIVLLDVPSTSSSKISLIASDHAIVVPTSVTIPAGQVSTTFNFTVASGFNANHVFSITATMGSMAAVAYGTVAGSAGFQVSAGGPQSWPKVNMGAGQSMRTLSVGASSVNGYSTTVSLECLGLTKMAQCQFDPPILPLRTKDIAYAQWTLSVNPGTAQGSYPAQVRVTDGVLTQDIAFTLNIGDFTLDFNPAVVHVLPTDIGNTTLTLGPINQFDQVVDLSCSGGLPAGVECLVESFGIPQAGGEQMTVGLLTQSAPVGNYQFTITGTSSPLTHSASAQVQVWDFSATASPTGVTAKAGGSADVTVTINSSNGFNGNVYLQCQTPTSLIACSFNSASPMVPADGSVTSTLTLTASAQLKPAGQHRLGSTFTGTILAVPFGLLLCGRASRRKGLSSLMLILVTALLLSCGGGSSGSGGGGGGGGGTKYSIGVTASTGNTTHSAGTITLTVN